MFQSESEKTLHLKLLDNYIKKYDENVHLLQEECLSRGYHTKMSTGDIVHPTRDSLEFALALLDGGRERDIKIALDILRKIFTHTV